jgi:ComF family protein
MVGQYIEPMLSAMRTRLAAALSRAGTRAAAAVPAHCEICRQATRGTLCADCRARFVVARLRCPRCALPVSPSRPPAAPGAAPGCGTCTVAPLPFGRAVAALDYAFPWDGLIRRLKFDAAPELAAPLAGLLADAVRAADAPRPDLVVPVPLSQARLAERGYNQAWELARHVAAALALPARADALRRVIDTPHQTGLARAERERNLRNAFAPAPDAGATLAGRHVVLVDDVMTTGVTVREAAAALRRAGAAAIDLWLLARTPDPVADPGPAGSARTA